MWSISLRNAEHVRHYSMCPHERAGWEVKLEEDSELTHRACYHDWHRVEQALAVFRLEVSDLTARGWQVARDEAPREHA